MEHIWVAGAQSAGSGTCEVRSPFDQQIVGVVALADARDVERALQGAVAAALRLARIAGHERGTWLKHAAVLLKSQSEEFARTISLEEGKTLPEARLEVSRAIETLELSGEEARRLAGEAIPLDGSPGGAGKIGFTLRVPCGVVVAITPFNFPLNLVTHKVGPALAGGNAVILKPATATPLTALKLTRLLIEAGVPADALSCLVGAGGIVGKALCEDRRVRKLSFTGSHAVGEAICRMAGVKRVTMELGSNAPLVVLEDADLDQAVATTVVSGFSNAGQVCISTQRILVDQRLHDDFLDALKAKVAALTVGDPLNPATQMGPMIHQTEARRVADWIAEGVAQGARLVTGGACNGAMMQPTILAEVDADMKVAREELFGPAVCVTACHNFAAALQLANDTRFGLSAAVFTRDLDRAMRFIRDIHAGNLHINGGPAWRADLMPYGGLRDSGFGKEGPCHAIREMTEEKMVVIHSAT